MADKFQDFKKELDELCKKYGTEISEYLDGDLIGVTGGVCVDMPTDDGRTVRHYFDECYSTSGPDEDSDCWQCKLFEAGYTNYCLRYKEFHKDVRTIRCNKRIYDDGQGTRSHYSRNNPPPPGELEE